jgi:hypothetical protein
MRVGLEIDLKNGEPPQTLYTNMFVMTEWEDVYNRKISDGRGMGYSDMCAWAYILLGIGFHFTKENVKKWIKENPEMTIKSVVDETNPNHTGGVLTEGN